MNVAKKVEESDGGWGAISLSQTERFFVAFVYISVNHLCTHLNYNCSSRRISLSTPPIRIETRCSLPHVQCSGSVTSSRIHRLSLRRRGNDTIHKRDAIYFFRINYATTERQQLNPYKTFLSHAYSRHVVGLNRFFLSVPCFRFGFRTEANWAHKLETRAICYSIII